MYDFSKVEAPRKINRNYILDKVGDQMIFGYYFGNFEIGKIYPSVFRKDRHPSTGFYISKSGKLIYNDMARKGENHDCFSFVAKMYGLSFSDTIKKIATDFGLITGEQSAEVKKVMKNLKDFDRSFKKDTKIHFRPRKWDEEGLAFWKKHGITEQELIKNNIYLIKDLFINEIPIYNKDNEIRYALTVQHKGEMLTKLYSPESKSGGLKWCSNIPNDVPFGLEDLNISAPFIFITKAQKDRIILKKFLPCVIATQNESEQALPKSILTKIDFRYGKKYIGWDPDEKGLTEMDAMKQKGFIPVVIPKEMYEKEGIKDVADLAREKGLNGVESFLKSNNLLT